MSEYCPKLLDLIPKNKQWGLNYKEDDQEMRNDNKKLELRLGLGLPSDERWFSKNTLNKNGCFRERNDSLLSLNHKPWPLLHHAAVTNESSSQPCCTSKVIELNDAKKKAFSSPVSAITAVPNTSQKRAAPAPVVGWPPIRSFRKNLATTSATKSISESQDAIPSKPMNEKPATKSTQKGQFVKINMDGVPIGRKLDLNVYDSYGKLSSAVDELFRGLLAAQRDSCGEAMDDKEEQKMIRGIMDESGEYTLVYEDNEGDRMLVGDVPWHMFVSTVKRLRVLKSSDLPTLSRGNNEKGKVPVERASVIVT